MEMANPLPPRRGRKGRGRSFVMGALTVSMLFFFAAAAVYYLYFMENTERVQPDFNGVDKPVLIGGELAGSASGTGASLSLSFDWIREHLDPYMVYDEKSESVIITTADKVVQFPTEQLTGMINGRPVELRFPVTEADGVLHIPVEPLKELYGIRVEESAETGAVFIYRPGEIIQRAAIRGKGEERVPLRTGPSIKEPIVADLEPGTEVRVLDDPEAAPQWLRVQTEAGYTGYVKKDRTRLLPAETVPDIAAQKPRAPWKPIGGKIQLTWEHVVSRNPDPSTIPDMPGLNVISPTWFSLQEDKNGNIYVGNKADPAYVDWAHRRGYQVWALFSNSFDPDLTARALADYETRAALIRQIVHFVTLYDLDGINIDFENVYLKEKDALTQFVREMVPLLHELDAVVSMDVTVRGGSEMWSLFLDREELGKVLDYMIVMTYDEHWASSPVAGSVASLPWVEKGIVDIMREDKVPASKLVLGVPFYTYMWTETTEGGKTKVTSRARSMQAVQDWIAEKGLKPVFLPEVGQHYVEYAEDDRTKIKVWIEDATSMRARAELVRKYDLAGIASWRRGFETPDIWHVISETLAKRP